MNREILVCGGTGCLSSKSEQIIKNLETLISVNGLEKEVIVKKTGCFGFCEKGPIVKILPDNVLYIPGNRNFFYNPFKTGKLI